MCFTVQRVKPLADLLQLKGPWVILAKCKATYSRGPDGRFLPAITMASTTSGTSTPISMLPSLLSSPSSLTLMLASSNQEGNSGASTPIYPPPPPSTPLIPYVVPHKTAIPPKVQPAVMTDRNSDEPFAGEDTDTLDPRDFLKRVQRYLMSSAWENAE